MVECDVDVVKVCRCLVWVGESSDDGFGGVAVSGAVAELAFFVKSPRPYAGVCDDGILTACAELKGSGQAGDLPGTVGGVFVVYGTAKANYGDSQLIGIVKVTVKYLHPGPDGPVPRDGYESTPSDADGREPYIGIDKAGIQVVCCFTSAFSPGPDGSVRGKDHAVGHLGADCDRCG